MNGLFGKDSFKPMQKKKPDAKGTRLFLTRKTIV